MIVKWIGIFLIAVAVALILERRKRKKGKETFESKHNINVRTWQIVVLAAIGIILVFGTNFRAKVTVTDSKGNETVVAEYSEEKKNQENSSMTKNEDEGTSIDKGVTKDISNLAAGEDTELVSYSVIVGSSQLNFSLPETWATEETEYGLEAYPEGENMSVMFTDSYIEVGDYDSLELEKEAIGSAIDVETNAGTFELNGKENMVIYYDYEGHFRATEIYQDIGASQYLLISVYDYGFSYSTEDILDWFTIELY